MSTSHRCNQWHGYFLLAWVLILDFANLAVAKATELGKPLPDPKGYVLEGAWPNTGGKVLLVDFWASWCGPCKKSFPFLDSLQQRYKAQGLIVIGVSLAEDAAGMNLKQHGVSFPTVRDQAQKFVQALKVDAMPTSLVVDRPGTVRYINAGFKHTESEAAIDRPMQQLLKGSQ